jgi:hypothetical protein
MNKYLTRTCISKYAASGFLFLAKSSYGILGKGRKTPAVSVNF